MTNSGWDYPDRTFKMRAEIKQLQEENQLLKSKYAGIDLSDTIDTLAVLRTSHECAISELSDAIDKLKSLNEIL